MKFNKRKIYQKKKKKRSAVNSGLCCPGRSLSETQRKGKE